MVDCDTQVIIAQDITTDANDVQQLKPMLETCEEVNSKRPEKALADAGYWSKANAQLADEQTELFIATIKDWNRRKELREADPQVVRAKRTHGAETPDETRQRHLPQAQPERRSSVWSACHPQLRPIPVTWGDGSTSGVVVVSATHNLLKLWPSGRGPDGHEVADAIAR